MTLVVALGSWVGCRSDEPRSDVVQSDPDRSLVAANGVLFSTLVEGGDGWALVVDGKGKTRWSVRAPAKEHVGRVRRARNGDILVGLYDPEHEEGVGLIQRFDDEGNVLTETLAPTFHHDLVELNDNRFAYLGHVFGDVEVGMLGVVPVATDQVRVGPEGGVSEGVFDFLSDYSIEPYWPCDHMALDRRVEGYYEWTHSNSLVPWGDGFLLMARWIDTLVALDADYNVVWRLGGPESDLDGGETPLFQHAHMSWAEGNRVLIFDNGWDHAAVRPPSRVIELEIDVAGGTATEVWSYQDPEGASTQFLGDAQRLANGNTLISWGGLGRVTEVTPTGDVVWRLDVEVSVGRVELWEGVLP